MAEKKTPKTSTTRRRARPQAKQAASQTAASAPEPPEAPAQRVSTGPDLSTTPTPLAVSAQVEVSNNDPAPTVDITLWQLIKLRQPNFEKYRRFLDSIFCPPDEPDPVVLARAANPELLRLTHRFSLQRTDAYDGLKIATDMFLRYQCAVLGDVQGLSDWVADVGERVSNGTPPDPAALQRFADEYLADDGVLGAKTLPYLAGVRQKLGELLVHDCKSDIQWARYAAACGQNEILCDRLGSPCLIELLWSYWMEQGMLMQSINAIALRFQNRRSDRLRDPLANLTLDPLRPLNNLLWGFIQDERSRLSVKRRALEYDHEYGLQLTGKAVGSLSTVDSRSSFLEAFHTLLTLATRFYKQDDDRQIRADAFPVLNALRDLHMVLAQGAHNQFGDLPWVARVEMMVVQYLLARPEMREFFGSRTMVLLKEPWMDRVDAMNKLQGWTSTGVTHFHDLALNGEQILLSVRYGHWNEADPDQAFHWAATWRSEIQRYVFAYRAVTGVDLTGGDDTARTQVSTRQPSELIRRRAAASAAPATKR